MISNSSVERDEASNGSDGLFPRSELKPGLVRIGGYPGDEITRNYCERRLPAERADSDLAYCTGVDTVQCLDGDRRMIVCAGIGENAEGEGRLGAGTRSCPKAVWPASIGILGGRGYLDGVRIGRVRLKALEDENARLKKLLEESMMDVSTLREMLGKNF